MLPDYVDATLTRGDVYFGDMCDKHPDAAGQRKLRNRQCIECWRTIRSWRLNTQADRVYAQQTRIAAASRGESTYIGITCPDHEHDKPLRFVLTDQCVECAKVNPKPVPKTSAEHQRAYRERLKARTPPKPEKPPVIPKTAAERQREYRLRKKVQTQP